jgi:hypothetical protein
MMLEQLYYIGELVGVIAIVGSMLFVGVQMRQNTQAMRISAGQGMIASWGLSNRDITGDPGFAEVMAPLLDDSTDIPEGADGLRVRLWAQNIIRGGEHNYYNWAAGALEERYWQQVQANANWLLSTRAGREIWSEVRGNYGAEFRAVLDDLAKKTALS